jgi:hypothetical protein
MINILLHTIAYACLSFSVIGFISTSIEMFTTKSYTLLRVIVYCLLFGVGLALL